MTILHMEVLEQSTGEVIAEILKGLSERVGPLYQIISDHGSDIKKGQVFPLKRIILVDKKAKNHKTNEYLA
ncbi:hypothetical protein QUF82_22045 [Thiotrichales bacterium HSG14]|nr:hypothetical protein [Thiotrichales bacterium HSG14]